MQTIFTVQALHSYRVHLVPPDVNLADAGQSADVKVLVSIRLKAINALQAREHARTVTDMQVLRVEHVQAQS